MRYKTNKLKFSSSRKLAGEILADADFNKVKVISFDVFNTLLYRRLHPDAVLEGVATELSRLVKQAGMALVKTPMEARSEAYWHLSSRAVEKGLDPDTTLEQLAPAWLRALTGNIVISDNLVNSAIRIEYEFESLAVCPNPYLLDLIPELKSMGLRVIFCSDMYLGYKYISRLIENNGFKGFFSAGYVSGDYCLLKRTGRLFEKIIEVEGVKPEEIMHIGDDINADGYQAIDKGLKVRVLFDTETNVSKSSFDLISLKKDPSWTGVVASSFSRSSSPITPEELYGTRILGPIYAAFVHRLAERCMEKGVKRVYFLAREGYLLKKLFELIAPVVWCDTKPPTAIYLSVSRLTTFLASSPSYGFRELSLITANGGATSVSNLLAPLRMPESLLSSIAQKYGIQDINGPLPASFLNWIPLHRLLSDPLIKGEIKKISSRMHELLEGYLHQVGFFNPGPIAIVDVGWSGQIQDNIFEAFKEKTDFPMMHGFYLGTKSSAKWRETSLSTMEGILCDETDNNWHANSAFHFVQAFEAISRGPHGTVIDYSNNISENRTVPVFKAEDDPSRVAEKKDELLISLLQAGIIAYVKDYSNCIKILGASAQSSIPYAHAALDRMVRYPSSEEAHWLLGLSNVSDLGSSDTVLIGDSIEKAKLLSIGAAKSLIKKSLWKYGTISLLRFPFINFTYSLFHSFTFLPNQNCVPYMPNINFNNINLNANKESFSLNSLNLEFENDLERRLDRNVKETLDKAKKSNHIYLNNSCIKPLSSREVFVSNFTGFLINLFLAVGGKPIYELGGVSFKKILLRELAIDNSLYLTLKRSRLEIIKNAFALKIMKLKR